MHTEITTAPTKNEFSHKRIAGLDLIRCVAILLVLLTHCTSPIWSKNPLIYKVCYWAGYLGVEIFFVLSGFLIGSILLKQAEKQSQSEQGYGWEQLSHFWSRRWFRTLPNYVLFLFAYMISQAPWKNGHWDDWLLSAFFLQNFYIQRSTQTFGISWSLCVEEWMYLLLPIAFMVCLSVFRRVSRSALSVSLILILLPMLLRLLTASGRMWNYDIRMVVLYRLDAIACGVLLSYISLYLPNLMRKIGSRTGVCIGLSCLLFLWAAWAWFAASTTALNVSYTGVQHLIWNVFYFSCVSLSLMPVVAWSNTVMELPKAISAFVYRTSLYSYSLYLFHIIAILHISPLIHHFVFRDAEHLGILPNLISLILAYGISALIYHGYESPMTRLRDRFSPKKGV